MLAIVVTSLSLVLRTARTAWDRAESDYGVLHHAHTVARHFVRQAREASAVTAHSTNGRSITLRLRDGNEVSWTFTPGTTGNYSDVVTVGYSSSGEQGPLAYGIRELNFVGYDANSNITSTVEDIQLVKVTVTVGIGRRSALRNVTSYVWIRTW